MARQLIDSMSETWDPTAHPNTYRKALEKLVASKRKFALPEPEAKEGEPRKVVDLMEALRKSLGHERGATRSSGKSKSASRRRGAA
jgi:DNA end-binding protein Ku